MGSLLKVLLQWLCIVVDLVHTEKILLLRWIEVLLAVLLFCYTSLVLLCILHGFHYANLGCELVLLDWCGYFFE